MKIEAQNRAMRVFDARLDGSRISVRTTGASLIFEADGTLVAFAELGPEGGRERPLFRLRTASRSGWELLGWNEGEARLRSECFEVTVRDDSTLVLGARKESGLDLDSSLRADYAVHKRGQAYATDGSKGFGVYGAARNEVRLHVTWRPSLRVKGHCRMGSELWLAICPSRPPDFRRLGESIAHEGRPRPFPQACYPASSIIQGAARHCQILALHAYFWRGVPFRVRPKLSRYVWRRCSWMTDYHVPTHPAEFERVLEDARREGLQVVLYLSPFYSLAPDIEEEMRRVVELYDVDGLYLDGLSRDFRRAYDIVRGARRVLGPDRCLYMNMTDHPFGTSRIPVPFIDTHADFVLRGASGRQGLDLDRFLRYVVSGWGSSHALGVWCYYGSARPWRPINRVPSEDHIRQALSHHVRLWRRSTWRGDIEAFDRVYYPELGKLVEKERAAWEGRLVADPEHVLD